MGHAPAPLPVLIPLAIAVGMAGPGADTAWGAPPAVTIRAETRIQLHMERQGPSTRVRGVLRDDRGTPLVGRDVTLFFRGGPAARATIATRTDGSGAFQAEVPTGAATEVVADFPPTELFAGARVRRDLDPSRADVRLGIAVSEGGQIDLDGPPVSVTVTADSDAGKEGVALRLEDELGRPLARGRTDARGRAGFELDPADVGPRGPGRIVAHALGDDRRSGTTTEYPIVRLRRTSLGLDAPEGPARAGREVVFRGALRFAADPEAPVSGGAVGVFIDGTHVGTAVTDDQGRFEVVAVVPPGDGPRSVLARFESARAGLTSAESAPREILWRAARRRFLWWAALPLLATALAWLALGRGRRTAASTPREPEPTDGRSRLVQPPPRSAGNRGRRREVSGVVRAARTGAPVPGARVRFLGPSGETASTETDLEGAFRLRPGEPGRGQLRVQAPGFAPFDASLSLPHRGEWEGIEVRVATWRQAAGDAFRGAVLPRLPERRRWRTKTNRELAREAGRQSPELREPLERLEARVSAIEYGPSLPPEDELVRVLQEADAVRGDRVEPPPTAPTPAAAEPPEPPPARSR